MTAVNNRPEFDGAIPEEQSTVLVVDDGFSVREAMSRLFRSNVHDVP